MKRILIVDDDVHIGNMLEEALAREGYSVSRAYSGTEAVMSVKLCKPDLVLLDLMLPGLSGEEVLPKLRGIPVIVMSAKASVDSKVELLLGGAADYVTKPFVMRELLARIVAALRSPAAAEPEALSFGALRLDTGAHGELRRKRGAAHAHGIRHIEAAHVEPGPGGDPLRHPRTHRRGHAGLH